MTYALQIFMSMIYRLRQRLQISGSSVFRNCSGGKKGRTISELQHFCDEYPIVTTCSQASLRNHGQVVWLKSTAVEDFGSWHQVCFPNSPTYCTFDMLSSTALPCASKIDTIYTLYPTLCRQTLPWSGRWLVSEQSSKGIRLQSCEDVISVPHSQEYSG